MTRCLTTHEFRKGVQLQVRRRRRRMGGGGVSHPGCSGGRQRPTPPLRPHERVGPSSALLDKGQSVGLGRGGAGSSSRRTSLPRAPVACPTTALRRLFVGGCACRRLGLGGAAPTSFLHTSCQWQLAVATHSSTTASTRQGITLQPLIAAAAVFAKHPPCPMATWCMNASHPTPPPHPIPSPSPTPSHTSPGGRAQWAGRRGARGHHSSLGRQGGVQPFPGPASGEPCR